MARLHLVSWVLHSLVLGTVGLVMLVTARPAGAQGAIIFVKDPITTGSDGALWFGAQQSPNLYVIARMTTTGAVTTFPTSDQTPNPSGITAGPDGAIWFTTTGFGKI